VVGSIESALYETAYRWRWLLPTAAAMWLISSFNYSTLPKRNHPRPPIEQTVTPEQIAPLHLQATQKEASAAKDEVSPAKHHKRRVFARLRNNYYRYGNVWGYAQAYRNGFWR
jgi:hypothetical protein